jgi:hypothetical protein
MTLVLRPGQKYHDKINGAAMNCSAMNRPCGESTLYISIFLQYCNIFFCDRYIMLLGIICQIGKQKKNVHHINNDGVFFVSKIEIFYLKLYFWQ